MTPREVILAQIEHKETCPVPYTLGCEDPELGRKLREHYGNEHWRELFPTYMAGVGGFDLIARTAVDEVYARDVYGTKWRLDRRPWHMEEPGLKEPSLQRYAFPTLDQFVSPTFAEDVQKALDTNRDSFTIIHMGWGLFEQAWGIRGFENAMMDAVAEPEFYEEFLGKLTELRLGMVRLCADLPADAIMFGDDWGDQRGVIIGPERWRQFLKPCWARIYDAVHAQGKFVVSHCCGSIADIMPDVIEIGLDVLESVQPEPVGMNPYDLKKLYGDKITFWGCLGSQSTIQFGTPRQIQQEIQRLASEMGRGGGYILAPAKALQPGTPFENALAVVQGFTEQEG